MVIKNGLVYQENKTFLKKDLYILNGIIVDKEFYTDHQNIDNLTNYNAELDAEGLYVIPGLIDIHSHGAVGEDFSDGDLEGLKRLLSYEYSHGITSYCPTSMSLEKDTLLSVFHAMKDWQDEPGLSNVIGLNMEGPFLDVDKKGSHRSECLLNPDVDFFRKCNEESGKRIRLVTLSPNLKNSMDFIKELKDEVVISLGHTSADYETTKEALKCGASHITHLFNAMNQMQHRNPGPIPAAAEDDNCYAELICDGVHVHPSMIKAAFSLFPDKIVLISDSIRAAGMEIGTYDLGGQKVFLKKLPLPDDKGNVVFRNVAKLDDGTIAGSVANLFECMKYAISIGISPEEAIAAATMNPAKSIGIYDTIGSLSPGKKADILLLDQNYKLLQII